MMASHSQHTDPATLADVWHNWRARGMSEAEQLSLRRRLLSLQLRTAAVERQKLLIVESLLPLRAAGWWMPELAELVGADLVISRKGAPPTPMIWDDLSAAAPDLIIIASSGASLDENIAFAQHVSALSVPLYAVDARLFFSTPDANLVETAEILAEVLHQDARLDFGHCGKYWQRAA